MILKGPYANSFNMHYFAWNHTTLQKQERNFIKAESFACFIHLFISRFGTIPGIEWYLMISVDWTFSYVRQIYLIMIKKFVCDHKAGKWLSQASNEGQWVRFLSPARTRLCEPSPSNIIVKGVNINLYCITFLQGSFEPPSWRLRNQHNFNPLSIATALPGISISCPCLIHSVPLPPVITLASEIHKQKEY